MHDFRVVARQLFLFLLLIILFSFLANNWDTVTKNIGESEEIQAFITLFPFLPYLFLIIVLFVSWRYSNTGLILTAFLLGLAYYASLKYSATFAPPIYHAVLFFTPINLVIFSNLTKRKVFSIQALFWLIIIFLEAYFTFLFFHLAYTQQNETIFEIKNFSQLLYNAVIFISNSLIKLLESKFIFGYQIPSFIILSFLISFVVFFISFIKKKDAITAGFLVILICIVFPVFYNNSKIAIKLYFLLASLVLLISTVESSFALAYIDELTGLFGRRSLNDMMYNLRRKYAIAMIDIDHFKKFNDKYGHKVGDQVLKLIAAKLMKLKGNAKVYRFGGEEFTAIFSGKYSEETKSYLEDFRKSLAEYKFVIRGKDRKTHTEEQRGSKKIPKSKKEKITVSIGLADSKRTAKSPQKVLKRADKALYKAKKAGRNRLKIVK